MYTFNFIKKITVICARVAEKNRFLYNCCYPDFFRQQLTHGRVSIFMLRFHKNPHLALQRILCREQRTDALFFPFYAVRLRGALQNDLFPE